MKKLLKQIADAALAYFAPVTVSLLVLVLIVVGVRINYALWRDRHPNVPAWYYIFSSK